MVWWHPALEPQENNCLPFSSILRVYSRSSCSDLIQSFFAQKKKMQLWRTILLTPFKLITVFLHEASHAIACKLTCGQVRCFLFIILIFFCKLVKFPCCVSCVFLLAIVWNTKFLSLSLPHTPILPPKKKKTSVNSYLNEFTFLVSLTWRKFIFNSFYRFCFMTIF